MFNPRLAFMFSFLMVFFSRHRSRVGSEPRAASPRGLSQDEETNREFGLVDGRQGRNLLSCGRSQEWRKLN